MSKTRFRISEQQIAIVQAVANSPNGFCSIEMMAREIFGHLPRSDPNFQAMTAAQRASLARSASRLCGHDLLSKTRTIYRVTDKGLALLKTSAMADKPPPHPSAKSGR